MLDRLEFIELPFDDKIRKLYFDGEFIVSIRYYKHKVNLYLYNGYYVEVFYNPKMDKIDNVEIFDTSSSRMNFYADQIKIPVN